MKVNATISNLLTNKLLLKVIYAISVFNIIGYIIYGNINAAIVFVLIGVLVKHFSNNMRLILGIPLLIVNLFMLGQYKNNRTFEGMENNTSNSNNNDSSNIKDKITNQQNNDTNNNNNMNNDNNNMNNDNNNNMNNDNNNNMNNNNDTQQKLPTSVTEKKPTDEPFEVGRKKKQNNIDYASTIEDAYDELNKIIGSDGIKKLTGDTQNLMQQQLHLAEAMKGMQPLIANMGPLMETMGPMIQQAQGLIGAGGSGGSSGGFDMASLAKKFTASS